MIEVEFCSVAQNLFFSSRKAMISAVVPWHLVCK
jgi:hypothetical protein